MDFQICSNTQLKAGTDCRARVSEEDLIKGIDWGSYDPDDGDTITLSVNDKGPFEAGDQIVLLTATDNHGYDSVPCRSTVTAVNVTGSEAVCITDFNIELDKSGQATLADIDGG